MKICLVGAGSTIFSRNILGDVLLIKDSVPDLEIALYDIDETRLRQSLQIVNRLNHSLRGGKAIIKAHLGIEQRREALTGSHFVINVIQVGGYRPSTLADFEIPRKYGLRQTIADTLGIGGIFRALRTIPVVLDIAKEMEELCPEAWFLNYTNPMAIVTGAVLKASEIRAVGLCHSVQACVPHLLTGLGLSNSGEDAAAEMNRCRWEIAGINHMAWLTRIERDGKDLYPEIKLLAAEKNRRARAGEIEKHDDMVRYEIMQHFGYYVTESSEHNAEYTPYWIKNAYPGLIEEFNIPLDEYPRRCEEQIKDWEEEWQRVSTQKNSQEHERSHEYGSYIIEAAATDRPYRIHGNIMNNGFITNLPSDAIVEVPCLVDRNGIQGTCVGRLPEVCASLNRTNVNVHLLVLEAALRKSRESIYHAAYLDPHTASELTLDGIRSLCDELIEAHKDYLPEYK